MRWSYANRPGSIRLYISLRQETVAFFAQMLKCVSFGICMTIIQTFGVAFWNAKRPPTRQLNYVIVIIRLQKLMNYFRPKTSSFVCLETWPETEGGAYLKESAKHCNTCLHSYMECEHFHIRQKCRSPKYNSPNYTHEMLMEDWGRGHCRFWTPNIQKGNLNEK